MAAAQAAEGENEMNNDVVKNSLAHLARFDVQIRTDCPGCADYNHRRATYAGPTCEKLFRTKCMGCGTAHRGRRYVAHGWDPNHQLVHLELCQDCANYVTIFLVDPAPWYALGLEDEVDKMPWEEAADLATEEELLAEEYDAEGVEL